MSGNPPREELEALAYDAFEGPPHAPAAFLAHLVGDGSCDVLDIGCGTGRLLAPLAARGWRVTGMEPYGPYLRSARERAEGCEGVRVAAGGFGELDGEGCFDLIAAINGPLAYLPTPADRQEALRRCARALRPGGLLVLDLPNFLWILRNYHPPAPAVATAGGWVFHRAPHHEVVYDRALWRHTDRIRAAPEDDPDAIVHFETVHELSIATLPEIAAGLADAGFASVRTYDHLQARTPGRLDGPRMVIVATRQIRTGARESAEG